MKIVYYYIATGSKGPLVVYIWWIEGVLIIKHPLSIFLKKIEVYMFLLNMNLVNKLDAPVLSTAKKISLDGAKLSEKNGIH